LTNYNFRLEVLGDRDGDLGFTDQDVATGGNQRQIGWLSEPQKQVNSVATGCHRLRRES